MTASKTNQIPDLSEHRRKIFFERLSPRTTNDSLRDYLSGFEIEVCSVPLQEGRNKGYGYVIFRKESSVDNVMSNRPHQIDGQAVELYRSVPDQGRLKEKKGVKTLIVSGIKNGLGTKSDLEQYFSVFGSINRIYITCDEDSWSIEFDDYDAVDKALLDRPHKVRNIDVHLMKGNRTGRFESIASSKIVQPTYHNNNNTSTIPKKSNMKQVQIDPQVSSMNIPKRIYCIHITNLPLNADAEILSKKFNWPMDTILINSPSDNQLLPIECWLKSIDRRQIADDFVERWNEQVVLGSKIKCEVDEDKFEFCNKFRNGKCRKTSDECDWEHIMCIANGRCSNDCPYGHREGMKPGYIHDRSNEMYRLKITGFQKKLTPEILARILQYSQEKACYINPYDDRIGYIIQLRTIKYAKRLLTKWHNKEIDGQKLKCQIELHIRSSPLKTLTRCGSMSHLEVRENDFHHPSRRFEPSDNTTKNDRDISASRENNRSIITTLDDQELNCDARIFDRSVGDIVKQKDSDTKRKSRSAETFPSYIHPKSQTSNELSKCEKMSTNETPEDGRKMSLIRKRKDHGSLACLVEYKNTDKEIYQRELNALKLLKDVKGVVQLIELENPSNNDNQQDSAESDHSFITEHISGHSLKEFINRIHRGGFGVLEAVQLVQNLTTIVKQVHSQGVLHQNLRPENIMIDWDSTQTSIVEGQLKLVDFSQAYIKSETCTQTSRSISECWYKAPQANVESLKYSSTIDASSICAILFWLLTNTDPRYDQDLFPHQQDNVMDKLDNKIAQAVRTANTHRKQFLEETHLKTYLIDTFNIGFGYPHHQPWTISDLECRLESIRELLSPRNPKLNTTDTIFKDLISTYNNAVPAPSITTNVHQDIFQKASIAFRQAKTKFSESTNDQYSWSDGSCTWLDSTQTSMNERRHDDILTYYSRDRHMSSSCSVIIICLATLTDEGNQITLSIGSAVNGKMSRIPIGRYSKTQNYYIAEFQKDFGTELNNLIISISKERRAMLQ